MNDELMKNIKNPIFEYLIKRVDEDGDKNDEKSKTIL
jgi:hypothetical protein